MHRFALPHTPFAAQIAFAAATLVLIVTVAFFAQQSKMPTNFVPVTGSQSMSAAVQKLDLGAGYTLVTNAQGTNIIAPEVMVKSVPESQSLDLGAGYTLRDGQIVAPASIVKTEPMTSRTLDLGAGYTLRDGQIVAPASIVKTEPMTSQALDLGAGYTLRDGQILAPASTVKAQSVVSQKIDIGGGYWLVLTGDSGEIVH